MEKNNSNRGMYHLIHNTIKIVTYKQYVYILILSLVRNPRIFVVSKPLQSPEKGTFSCYFENSFQMLYRSSKSDENCPSQVSKIEQHPRPRQFADDGSQEKWKFQQFSTQQCHLCLKMILVIILNEMPKKTPVFPSQISQILS